VATTLTNFYILPDTGDLGTVWFPALESNIQQLNDHTHNGVNSNKLTATSIEVITDNILVADFALDGSRYRVLKTVPAGTTVSEINISFRDPTTKDKIYLETALVSATTYYVYSMFEIDVEVVYG